MSKGKGPEKGRNLEAYRNGLDYMKRCERAMIKKGIINQTKAQNKKI